MVALPNTASQWTMHGRSQRTRPSASALHLSIVNLRANDASGLMLDRHWTGTKGNCCLIPEQRHQLGCQKLSASKGFACEHQHPALRFPAPCHVVQLSCLVCLMSSSVVAWAGSKSVIAVKWFLASVMCRNSPVRRSVLYMSSGRPVAVRRRSAEFQRFGDQKERKDIRRCVACLS